MGSTERGGGTPSALTDDEAYWRATEIEQNTLDHARQLWERHVQQTRHDTDDRADQLKGLARLSAIVAGFSMSSFLEFNFDASTVSSGLLIAYGISTALVAAIYTGCTIHCNLILGNVLQLSDSFLTAAEECRFLLQCREFAIRYQEGSAPPAPARSFRKMWEFRCSSSWRQCLCLFALGIPVFLVNMVLSGWIKFIRYRPAAVVMTAIMSVCMAVLCIVFGRLVTHLILSDRLANKATKSGAVTQKLPWSWHRAPTLYSKTLSYTGRILQPSSPTPFSSQGSQMDPVTLTWRQEDQTQQDLDNALFLWNGTVRCIQNSAEEKAEQMRSLSFLAGILLSFGMAALYQLVYDVSLQKYNAIKLMYSLTIALTVVCNLSTMTACGFLNMAVIKSAAQAVSPQAQASFLQRCRKHTIDSHKFKLPKQVTPLQSQEDSRVDTDFSLAFYLFTAGSIIFQTCLIFSAWLKFAPQQSNSELGPEDNSSAAIAMTVILSAGVVYTILITLSWARDSLNTPLQEPITEELPSLGLPFDWHLQSSPYSDGPQAHLSTLPQTGLLPFGPSSGSLYAILTPQTESSTSLPGADFTTLWAANVVQERQLGNALQLWQKFCSRNLNDLEERQEQLQAVTDLAAVIAGFEMIAFLQFQFDTTDVAPALQITYVLTSGLTVALMVFAMVVTGVMLLSLIESSKDFIGLQQEADFIARCCTFAERFQIGDEPPKPRTSLAKHWELRCEKEWRWAFYMFSLGIPCFLANAAITAWIKFGTYAAPAIVVTVLQGLAVLYLVASHARWSKHILGKPHKDHPQISQIGGQQLPFAWYIQTTSRT